MQRSYATFWVLFALSLFGLLFPHLAAGDAQDAGPLRLMAFATLAATGTVLADHYLFGDALFRSLSDL